jgi:hypothetical protein
MPADAPLTMTFNEAKEYAAKSIAHGHHDWRVPTMNELNVLFNNLAAIGGFNQTDHPLASWYSSSSSSSGNIWGAWGQRFSDGRQGDNFKYGHSSVRPSASRISWAIDDVSHRQSIKTRPLIYPPALGPLEIRAIFSKRNQPFLQKPEALLPSAPGFTRRRQGLGLYSHPLLLLRDARTTTLWKICDSCKSYNFHLTRPDKRLRVYRDMGCSL